MIRIGYQHPVRPDNVSRDPYAYYVRHQLCELAVLYRDAGPTGKIDRAEVDRLYATAPENESRSFPYFAGRIFELRGDKESALYYLKRRHPPRHRLSQHPCVDRPSAAGV